MITTSARLPAVVDNDDDDFLVLRKETVGLIGLCVVAAAIVTVAVMVWFATSGQAEAERVAQIEIQSADIARLNATMVDLAEQIQLQRTVPPAPVVDPAKVEPSAIDKASSLIDPKYHAAMYMVIGFLALAVVIAILGKIDQSGVAVPLVLVGCLIVGGMILMRG